MCSFEEALQKASHCVCGLKWNGSTCDSLLDLGWTCDVVKPAIMISREPTPKNTRFTNNECKACMTIHIDQFAYNHDIIYIVIAFPDVSLAVPDVIPSQEDCLFEGVIQ